MTDISGCQVVLHLTLTKLIFYQKQEINPAKREKTKAFPSTQIIILITNFDSILTV